MELTGIHSIYFLGIGGIGMSALARYFNRMGIRVSGYDKTPTALTNQLRDEGISVHFTDEPDSIPADIDLVIYTPAIPTDLEEFVKLSASRIPMKKRAEVLGELTRTAKTIAVAGTHGKTTVSSMIAHILHQGGMKCTAFLGGISKNYNSNLIVDPSPEWIIAEADEFDRSFLHISPTLVVITSMDADHLDVYHHFGNLIESFAGFVSRIPSGGTAILKQGLELKAPTGAVNFKYSLGEPADYRAANIQLEGLSYQFDLITPFGKIPDLRVGIPGLLNVENAVAAAAASLTAGIPVDSLREGLSSFSGNLRRFDIRFQGKTRIYIDDYAHHPEEIRAFVNSVRQLFRERKILGIFQPHLYSRTRDFAHDFAASLDLLDEIALLPIYPAREKPIAGITSATILQQMKGSRLRLVEKEDIIPLIRETACDVILTIGAGDIDQMVKPVEDFLKTHDAVS